MTTNQSDEQREAEDRHLEAIAASTHQNAVLDELLLKREDILDVTLRQAAKNAEQLSRILRALTACVEHSAKGRPNFAGTPTACIIELPQWEALLRAAQS